MKVYLKAFKIFALILLCSLGLTACNLAKENKNKAEPTALSKEEAIARYRQASYAFGWFEIYNIDYDSEEKIELDGKNYYRVSHETIHDLASMREFLGQYFTQNLIDSLLDETRPVQKFKEIDGVLYTNPIVRATDTYAGKESFDLVYSEGGDLINLLVDVEELDTDLEVVGSKEYTFLLKYIDGSWLFDDFISVR